MIEPLNAFRFRPFQYPCSSPNILKFISCSPNEFLQQRLVVLLLLELNLTCFFVVWSQFILLFLLPVRFFLPLFLRLLFMLFFPQLLSNNVGRFRQTLIFLFANYEAARTQEIPQGLESVVETIYTLRRRSLSGTSRLAVQPLLFRNRAGLDTAIVHCSAYRTDTNQPEVLYSSHCVFQPNKKHSSCA